MARVETGAAIRELWSPHLGAARLSEGTCRFRVWAPAAARVEVHLLGDEAGGNPGRHVPMMREERGYHVATISGVPSAALYVYRLDGKVETPDPASRFQPLGVNGPSQVCDRACSTHGPRSDAGTAWSGLPLEGLIIYELHVGTFSPQGTFAGVSAALPELASFGIGAVELMPIAQFSGGRGWGYDGVFPFAVQNSYGGPQGLVALADACHQQGLALILDVVYNHLGPEGNVLPLYGPYLNLDCPTPWGQGINFDGPGSDEVRRYYVENALYWLADCGVDGLRLDAVHAIVDRSAVPFLQQLAHEVALLSKKAGRRIHLFFENERNDARYLLPRARGGYGLTAQWNDDFHHSLHALLTGEKDGYYEDYGGLEEVAQALANGYVYGDRFSAFRDRHHGSSSTPLGASSLVVFAQNHDQVGNRPRGERLTGLTDFEGLKLAAGLLLLSPYIPLLFMGEEYGEGAPFLFFSSYEDEQLAEAARRGRRAEIGSSLPAQSVPDPQSEATFDRAKLDRGQRESGSHALLYGFYEHLISLRRSSPALARLSKKRRDLEVTLGPDILCLLRRSSEDEVLSLFHFGRQTAETEIRLGPGAWHRLLDSSDSRWGGPESLLPDSIRVPASGAVVVGLRPRSVAVLARSVKAVS
jgi:maltooligosyltrehalose trehalohydrolase